MSDKAFWLKLLRKSCRFLVLMAMLSGASVWVVGYASPWASFWATLFVFVADAIAGDEELV